MKPFSELKVELPPPATWLNTPPLGAAGLTYFRCLKSAGYARSPNADRPWRSAPPAVLDRAEKLLDVAAAAPAAAAMKSRRERRVIA